MTSPKALVSKAPGFVFEELLFVLLLWIAILCVIAYAVIANSLFNDLLFIVPFAIPLGVAWYAWDPYRKRLRD